VHRVTNTRRDLKLLLVADAAYRVCYGTRCCPAHNAPRPMATTRMRRPRSLPPGTAGGRGDVPGARLAAKLNN